MTGSILGERGRSSVSPITAWTLTGRFGSFSAFKYDVCNCGMKDLAAALTYMYTYVCMTEHRHIKKTVQIIFSAANPRIVQSGNQRYIYMYMYYMCGLELPIHYIRTDDILSHTN